MLVKNWLPWFLISIAIVGVCFGLLATVKLPTAVSEALLITAIMSMISGFGAMIFISRRT